MLQENLKANGLNTGNIKTPFNGVFSDGKVPVVHGRNLPKREVIFSG